MLQTFAQNMHAALKACAQVGLLAAGLAVTSPGHAGPASPQPFTATQPDGNAFQAVMRVMSSKGGWSRLTVSPSSRTPHRGTLNTPCKAALANWRPQAFAS